MFHCDLSSRLYAVDLGLQEVFLVRDRSGQVLDCTVYSQSRFQRQIYSNKK